MQCQLSSDSACIPYFGNDPIGFLESVDIFDASDNSPLASFADINDIGIDLVPGAFDDEIIAAAISLGDLTEGTTYTAKLNFSSMIGGGGGPNSPEFLVATIKTPEPVPLPAGILLMGTALAGVGVMSRRKKRKAA